MTGLEHYQEAERLLKIVDDDEADDTMLTTAQLLAMASVHSTLAIAAALRASQPGPCTSAIGSLLPATPTIKCSLRHGHAGAHESSSGTEWWSPEDGGQS